MKTISNKELGSHMPVGGTLAVTIFNLNTYRQINVRGKLDKVSTNWYANDVKTQPEIPCESYRTADMHEDVEYMPNDVSIELGGANINYDFAARYFDGAYNTIIVEDKEEFYNLVSVLAEGDYIVIFNSNATEGVCVHEFAETLSSEQKFAIVREEEVLWMGTSNQLLRSVACDDLLGARIKGIDLAGSKFCTYFGGSAQSWIGLMIQI